MKNKLILELLDKRTVKERNEFADKIIDKIRDFDNLDEKQKKELDELFENKYLPLGDSNKNSIYKEVLNQYKLDLAIRLVKNWSIHSQVTNSQNQTLENMIGLTSNQERLKQLLESLNEALSTRNKSSNFQNQQLQQRKKSLFSNIVSWIKKLLNFKSSQQQTRINKNARLNEISSTNLNIFDNRPTKNSARENDVVEIEMAELKRQAPKNNLVSQSKAEAKIKHETLNRIRPTNLTQQEARGNDSEEVEMVELTRQVPKNLPHRAKPKSKDQEIDW